MRATTRRSLARTALLLALALPSLGCGEPSPPFQSVTLTGFGLFAGRWLDDQGNLIIEVSSRGEPRFGIRLSTDFKLLDARAEAGRLVFRVKSEWYAKPVLGTLSFTGVDRAVITETLPSEMKEDCHLCANPCQGVTLRGETLIRNPPPAWLAEQSAIKARRWTRAVYRKTADAALDVLSRIL